MIHDNTPNRVFKISELTKLIVDQLVLISQQSAVNLACTCRCLEDPVLSTLWETQGSLFTLLGVFPRGTWDRKPLEPKKLVFTIVGDPSPEDWNRVRRYASWMRQVRVERRGGHEVEEDTFHKLRLNAPPGGWFPALRELSWRITTSTLPYIDLFFSPHLKSFSVFVQFPWNISEAPSDILPAIASTISALPAPTLQVLQLRASHKMPWAYFKDSISSVVLRCGPSFMEYDSRAPLSDAATDHLIQLPHLHSLRIHGPPPNYSTPSLPLVFPPLTRLTLGEGDARGWLSLLKRLDNPPTTQGATPLSKTEESLEALNIEIPFAVLNVDTFFSSTIQSFRNLANLEVRTDCRDGGDEGHCAFKLNNGNVAELVMALTRLESLRLGYPCTENTCATTIACLLPISVHCVELEVLEIHFNTTNIVDDFKSISEDPRYQELRSLPRCTLMLLDACGIPLSLDELGFEIVAKGMVDIFPSLTHFLGLEASWYELSGKITNLQRG